MQLQLVSSACHWTQQSRCSSTHWLLSRWPRTQNCQCHQPRPSWQSWEHSWVPAGADAGKTWTELPFPPFPQDPHEGLDSTVGHIWTSWCPQTPLCRWNHWAVHISLKAEGKVKYHCSFSCVQLFEVVRNHASSNSIDTEFWLFKTHRKQSCKTLNQFRYANQTNNFTWQKIQQQFHPTQPLAEDTLPQLLLVKNIFAQ